MAGALLLSDESTVNISIVLSEATVQKTVKHSSSASYLSVKVSSQTGPRSMRGLRRLDASATPCSKMTKLNSKKVESSSDPFQNFHLGFLFWFGKCTQKDFAAIFRAIDRQPSNKRRHRSVRGKGR